MDYQNRVGSKKGSGGVAGAEETRLNQRRLIRNILSSSLENDPYLIKNSSGIFECRLCLTLHYSESSYISHTEGKKHNLRLLERKLKDEKLARPEDYKDGISNIPKRSYFKIGKPGYKITKIRDPISYKIGLLIVFKYPKIVLSTLDKEPKYRIMSSFEQGKEDKLANSKYQYLISHAEPYENVCIKIPKGDITDLWTFWDVDLKEYYIQFFYNSDDE